MANAKITDLNALGAKPADADVLPIVDDPGGAPETKKVTFANLMDGVLHDNVAGEISAVAEKTAPVAADVFLIEDTEAANVKKRVQLGNLGLTDIGARVKNNANISINDSTQTTLTFNTELWDTDTIHDTGSNTERLTCKTAGKYLIVLNLAWAGDVDGYRIAQINLNAGATPICYSVQISAGTGWLGQIVTTIWDLDVDDYVVADVYHTAGAALNVLHVANMSPEFMMQMLSKA